MSDLELLFLVLACLYTWECACWLRRGSVAFLTWFGTRWRIAHPGPVGNQHGSFVLAPPLPPLGHILTANQFPLSLSSDGVLAYVASNVNPGWRPLQSGRFFRFEQIKSIEAKGKKVLINGETIFKAGTPQYAMFLARSVKAVQKLPQADRNVAIEKLFREMLDQKTLEKRWEEFKRLTASMPWLTNGLLMYLFAVVPVVIEQFGLKPTWLLLLIGILLLTTAVAISFRRAHKVLYPAMEDDRFTHFLTILLSPATAIRAQDILSRPLLDTFHPLAVAAVLCPPDAFQQLARNVLIDLRFPALPVCPYTQPGAEATERESRALLQTAIEAFLTRNKLKADDLSRPPKPLEETCRSYCPRCHAQFTAAVGVCSDCGGLELRPLIESPTA